MIILWILENLYKYIYVYIFFFANTYVLRAINNQSPKQIFDDYTNIGPIRESNSRTQARIRYNRVTEVVGVI